MRRYLLLGITVLYYFFILPIVMAQGQVDSINQPLLVDVKCSKCHTLKRIFVMSRPVEEWRNIVQEMMKKNPKWISPENAQQIVSEIVSIWPERVQAITSERKDYEDARFLFVDRCSLCHSINRVLIKNKSAEEWKETVERMRSEASDYITQEDAERIARFLSERVDLLREDVGGNVLVTKCLICHPGEQILLETHDRAGWEKIVEKMQVIARDAPSMARLGHEEAKLVVDILVKTQGSKIESSSP